MIETALQLAQMISQLAEDKKAKDVMIYDMNGKSSICDFQIVCTAESSRQANAIADWVCERIREHLKIKPIAIEGLEEGQWVFLDFQSVLFHVLSPDARDHYRLEKLWGSDDKKRTSSVEHEASHA